LGTQRGSAAETVHGALPFAKAAWKGSIVWVDPLS